VIRGTFTWEITKDGTVSETSAFYSQLELVDGKSTDGSRGEWEGRQRKVLTFQPSSLEDRLCSISDFPDFIIGASLTQERSLVVCEGWPARLVD
jgi:hypothetical protein